MSVPGGQGRMRVAILSKLSPGDGVVVYTRQLQAWLQGNGHAAHIVHFSNDPVDSNRPADPDVHALPYLVRSPGYTLPGPGSYGRLKRLLQELGPDLIHAQLTTSPLDFALPRLARELGVSVIGTFHHGWDYRPTRFGVFGQVVSNAYAPALARYTRVIVFGSRLRRHFESRGVAAERIAVIPNGVDAAAYAPGPSEFRLEGKLRVTYMGRMTADKNIAPLVETFAAHRHADLVLTLAGTGPLVASLKARFAADRRIEWLGFVADEAVRKSLWRGSDVVVLPSPIEGLSLSLLEGMASGCMPLATDVGEHADVLSGLGRVLDPLNVRRDLRSAWDWLAANREAVPALGAAARQRVLDRYTYERHWQALGELYAEVLR